jgi:parallel beta-helix repeat protein
VKLLPRRGVGVEALAVLVVVALIGGLTAALLPGGFSLRSSAETKESAACSGLAPQLVLALQRYVDEAGEPVPPPSVDAGLVDVAAVTQTYVRRVSSLGCRTTQERVRLASALQDLNGRSPVAQAIARTLRSRFDATGDAPVTHRLAAGEDLPTVVAALPTGSTLQLPAGRHRLDAPLVTLQGLTIAGEGRDSTSLESSAPDYALLHLGAAPLVLRRLTVRHTGTSAASVLVVPAAGYDLEGVRLTGAVGTAAGGGNGLIVGVRAVGRGGRSVIAGSELSHNTGAGLVVAVADRPVVSDSDFSSNGACGICFRGASGGTVRRSRFVRNGTGIDLAGTASPTITASTIRDSTRSGIALHELSRGTVSGNVVTGSGTVAVLAADHTATRVTGNTFSGHGKVGVALTGQTTAVVSGNRLDGGDVGVQVDGSAAPRLLDNTISGTRRAAGLIAGSSRPWISRSKCTQNRAGWVIATSAHPVFVADPCSRARQAPARKG